MGANALLENGASNLEGGAVVAGALVLYADHPGLDLGPAALGLGKIYPHGTRIRPCPGRQSFDLRESFSWRCGRFRAPCHGRCITSAHKAGSDAMAIDEFPIPPRGNWDGNA
jgi:hypothetical protein